MAIPLKRRREPVSYKEPSSDEGLTDSSDDYNESRSVRKRRAAPQRRSTRNQPSAPAPAVSPGSTRESPRVQLRGRRRISYQEDSTDEDNMDESESEEPATSPLRKTTSTRSSVPTPRSQKKKSKKTSKRMHIKPIGAPLKPRKGDLQESIRLVR